MFFGGGMGGGMPGKNFIVGRGGGRSHFGGGHEYESFF